MTPIKRENGYALAPQSLLAWIGVALVASVALLGVLFLGCLPKSKHPKSKPGNYGRAIRRGYRFSYFLVSIWPRRFMSWRKIS